MGDRPDSVVTRRRLGDRGSDAKRGSRPGMPRRRVVAGKRVGHLVGCGIIALVLMGWPAPGAAQQVGLDPARRPRVVNGLTTRAYPSAGALLYSQGGQITDA